MNAMLYLYKKTLINRIKKALKRPVTYIFILIIFFYLNMIFGSFDDLTRMMLIDSPQGLMVILTVSVFIFVPGNLISYSKRKGLLFRSSDAHFLFPSPIGPKKILLYAHVKTIMVNLIIYSILSIGGVLWFGVPLWKMVIFFLLSCVVQNLMEGAMMILMYGNERLNEKQTGMIRWVMYAIIGSFILIGIYIYVTQGMSIDAVMLFLNGNAIAAVPVIGWYIAALRLLFLTPTIWNIVFGLLYAGITIVLIAAAYKMKCTGQYYENAAKFAEDYEEVKQKSQKGEMARMGHKKKYKAAAVVYKGSYAKALFYRQLLEYKKQRFFIFGPYTLMSLGLGIGIAVFAYYEKVESFGAYIIIGIMAYVTFIFSSYLGKWGKELEKPYTFLLPDTPFRKLWYTTVIEHVRSLVDGCLLTIPGGIMLGLSVVEMILIIVIYMCLQACKLYCAVMVEALLGNLLGNTGKQFARILFEGVVIMFGVAAAVIGTIVISEEAGFIAMILVSLVMTAGVMVVAAMNFDRMEDNNK